VVVLVVLLSSTAWCIPHLGVSCGNHNSSRIGAITHNSNRGNSSSNSSSSTIAGCHQAVIAVSHQQLSMLQLWEDGPLCSRMPSAQAKQLAVSSSTRGQSVEGPSEVSCTMTTRSNYTTMEKVPMGEEVLVGTFSLNEHLGIILFDSGASHDFISCTCAKKAMLSMVAMEASYVISTPRGRVDTD
jgi:hypothetical protein